jgi:hypothetical protein
MSLPITCACGARLEIDERFAGQTIPCPDCQAPLQLPRPEPVRVTRISGLAIASLAVALVGGLTLVGGIAGMVLGYLARRRIEREPGRFTGQAYARAAMYVGGAGSLLTLLALVSPEVFHLDALLREFKWARNLDYTPAAAVPPQVKKSSVAGQRDITVSIPSRRWGVYESSTASGPGNAHLILVDPWDDAQIACQSLIIDDAEDQKNPEALRSRGLEHFLQSDLIKLLNPRNGALPKELKPREVKQLDEGTQEMLVDLRLGTDRTFALRMTRKGSYLFILAGGARKSRFARLHDEMRKVFDSFRVQE